MHKRILILAAALAALTAAPAHAANTWFVSPGGTGTDCTSALPCPFAYGVSTKAGANDDVDVADGDYTVPAGVLIAPQVTVHGSNPAFVHLNMSNTTEFDGLTLGVSSVLDNVSIVNTHGGAAISLLRNNAHLFQVDVRTTTGPALSQSSSGQAAATVSNSLLMSTGGDGVHVGSMSADSTLELRSDTIVGASHALEAAVFADGSTISALNTIFHARSGSHAITLSASTGNTLHWTTQNSNYPTIAPGDESDVAPTETAQQTDSPLFVADTGDVTTADLHEATGSPTIDAGADTFLAGTLDATGRARKIGTAPDIGAYEYFPPPTVTTLAATGVTTTEATLNGLVDGHGFDSSASFNYGTTTAYEAPPPDAINLDASASPQPVSLHLTGLTPGTTYHFTLDVVTGPAFGAGQDMTFTTKSPPPPPGGGTPPGGGPGPGPKPAAKCVVPRLKGRTLSAARKALRKAGCALGKVRRPRHARGRLVVSSQRVKAGRTVAAGTKVGVTLKPRRRRH